MLSGRDRLEFCYRSLNLKTSSKNNSQNSCHYIKEKMVWYFSGTVDWCVCPQPSLPPVYVLTPPPSLILLLALLAVSRLRCQQSSTSSSKSVVFFLVTVCGYPTPLPGQQILRPVQQLERCGLINQDLEGTQAIRSQSPLSSVPDRVFHSRSAQRSPASLSRDRGSRTSAGGYGISKT